MSTKKFFLFTLLSIFSILIFLLSAFIIPTNLKDIDPAINQLEATSTLTVHFIDVGQGDSVLIQTPNGNTILIDGGPKKSASRLVSYIKGLGIDKINIVVSTHPHEDHIGGLISVLNSFKVDNIIDSGASHTTSTYKNYLKAIKSSNINFVNWSLGQEFEIDSGIKFKILGPVTKSSSDLNNVSIVIKLVFNDVSFLFEGDAQNSEETQILSSGFDLKSDILKVGHHGSSSSSSISFLNAVDPEIAVISCGKGNSYGHPAEQTLANLTSVGAAIYRTDITGNIVIQCDGSTYNVILGSPFVYTQEETIQSVETQDTSGQQQTQSSGAYVGSKNSDVFHYPNCSYVKSISPGNMIWFSSREDAIAQGKRPCKRCNP